MSILQEYVSPDGRLRLLVCASPDGDLALGFDGYEWHTHADILARLSGLDQTEAVRRFVDDLLSDRAVIVLWGVPGEVRDVWVSADPALDKDYATERETIELRYWSGRPWVDT
jgi:hypothetical protein